MITAKEAREMHEAQQPYTLAEIEEAIRAVAKASMSTTFAASRLQPSITKKLVSNDFQLSTSGDLVTVSWKGSKVHAL